MKKQNWIHIAFMMFVLGVFLTGCQLQKTETPDPTIPIENPPVIETEKVISSEPTPPSEEPPVVEKEEENKRIFDQLNVAIPNQEKEWSWYENKELGFRMKHPQSVFMNNIVFLDGTLESCFLSPRDKEWRTVEVPLKFFVEDKTVYIEQEYFIVKNEEGVCEKMETTTDFIRENFPAWRMTFADVENEEELEAFIDQKYGEDCFLSELTPSTQENVYDVKMGSNSMKCHLNYIYVFRYSPVLKRAVAWSIGQDSHFATLSGAVDFRMKNTFEFIE